MKRFSLIAILVLLLSVTVQAPAAASVGDAHPNCADIVDGAGRYTTHNGTVNPTLEFEIGLGAPSCQAATYSIFVFDSVADGTQLASQTVAGGASCVDRFGLGEPCVNFDVVLAGGPPNVWFFITSSRGSHHVVDRAPDANRAAKTLCTDDATCPPAGESFN
jgi:hypothetical protein